MSKNSKGTVFYCFSPPVMIATFAIEITLGIYALVRYHMNEVSRLIVSALFMLGLFQLAEYFVCGGAGLNSSQWSRVGYVAITTLPPIGLHMMFAINGKPVNKLIVAAYTSMLAFITYFLVSPSAFNGYECTGNYVIFQLGEVAAFLYGLYYYFWLFVALFIGYQFIKNAKIKKNTKLMTKSLMFGYLVFLVPTATVNYIKPETRAGIPSIMCGFAVFFALILAFKILPLAAKKKVPADKTAN